MVPSPSVWITGPTRSGKTTQLVETFCQWSAEASPSSQIYPLPPILVFAATGDNRIELADRMAAASQGRYAFDSATPLGFFQDEVLLFWPLLVEQLSLKAQFPIRLRPETEQELATRLWQPELESGRFHQEGVRDYYLVRRTLDLLQLAATSGTPPEDIPIILKDGFAEQEDNTALWDCMGELLWRWRQWCLDRGFLTYGILTDLYWRYLLPHAEYQKRLRQRYRAVMADDVDEYPAIARSLFEFFLDQSIPAAFTFNPTGATRLGLGADPGYLEGLANRCQAVVLPLPAPALGSLWGEAMLTWIGEPLLLPELPNSIQTIQTVSRAQLLRETAEAIIQAVQSGQVQPQDIAVIGPGLDAIARYTLREILTRQGIAVESLNDQQPLISAPIIRAILTLMALVYPGLGRLLDRDAIAEMLLVLSQSAILRAETEGRSLLRIDPVRAGLITDHCFVPDPLHPHLLPIESFPRWDRLGYQAAQAYSEILQWLETQKEQQAQRLIPNPITLIDRAVQRFLGGGSHLPYDQLSALRELLETAQHYWDVDKRLRQVEQSEAPAAVTVDRFIQLLRNGTITADPYPVQSIGKASNAVMLATIFQYRANRKRHRWQFWLDAGSSLWLTGGGPLFGAPLFLQSWSGRPWTAAEALVAEQHRLQRQVMDLLCRVEERVYLCHSELATNGQEQSGPLLTLANAALATESADAWNEVLG